MNQNNSSKPKTPTKKKPILVEKPPKRMSVSLAEDTGKKNQRKPEG